MVFEKMPKLPGGADETRRNTLFLHKTRRRLVDELKASGRTVVGYGEESIVEVHPRDATKVAAHAYVSEMDRIHENRARKIYYTHRILHTLFPNNFPAIRAAFEDVGGHHGGTIRDRAYIEKVSLKFWDRFTPSKSFRHVENELLHIGIRPFGFDKGTTKNFGRERDNHQKYLDTNPFIHSELISKRSDIVQYMHKHEYAKEDIHTVSIAIDRLKTLTEAE